MHRFKHDDLARGSNLVMTMKHKFEPNDTISQQEQQQPQTKTLPSLSRQLSDPVKVKRTPAFRCEQKPFQRSHATSCREKKTMLKVSDKPSSVHLLRQQFDAKEDTPKRRIIPMALSARSNSSAEILLNRQANINNNNHQHNNGKDLTGLYTEPIPKSLRPSHAIHNMSTLRISDKSNKTDAVPAAKRGDDINYKLEALTDTLKLALKKPLPVGPAPQKPPRTFTHQSSSTPTSPMVSLMPSPLLLHYKDGTRKEFAAKLNDNLQRSLKSTTLMSPSSSSGGKPDAKYMLDKLENALKTNRIRRGPRSSSTDGRRREKVEVVIARTPPSPSRINLNCLPSLSCANNNKAYERLHDVGVEKKRSDEPVYAEPFAFLKAPNIDQSCDLPNHHVNGQNRRATDRTNRNSLYYMSTPISTEQQFVGDHSNALDIPRNTDSHQRLNDDVDTPSSSRSSMDDSPPNIKDLIKSFEEQRRPVDRVETLEKQLRRTLEQSFSDSSPPPPSNQHLHNEPLGQHDDAITSKYETYVRTIKLITQPKQHLQQRQMFHCCLLVSLCDKVPYIKFQYPPKAELPGSIAELIFPDSTCFDNGIKAQCYSIVITNNDGERIYGYCRRVLPEDSATCLPLAYCILSKNRAHRFYNRVLEEIESRHGLPDKERDALLQEFYVKRFPTPGQAVIFSMKQERKSNQYALINNGNIHSPERNGAEHIEITLDQDARHKENDLEELCYCMDTNLLIKVFASLLLERKVILLSGQLGRLSICMEALQNILYPFSWPHTLIPVIPRDLWEIVEAPTPLICGALSVMVVKEHDINDAIVIDLDNGTVLQEVGDEMSILPNCLVKEFKDGLSLAGTSRKSPNKENRSVDNVLLSDAFLRFFAHSCGHYKEYVHDNKFDMDGFVQHPKKKGTRRFLQWFSQSSMFATFADNVLADGNCYKIFDSRTRIYRSADANVIFGKMKEWRRNPTLDKKH